MKQSNAFCGKIKSFYGRAFGTVHIIGAVLEWLSV